MTEVFIVVEITFLHGRIVEVFSDYEEAKKFAYASNMADWIIVSRTIDAMVK